MIFALEIEINDLPILWLKARHYSAPSMTLAVQSQEELDTLQQWVSESFAAVPDNGKPRDRRTEVNEWVE